MFHRPIVITNTRFRVLLDENFAMQDLSDWEIDLLRGFIDNHDLNPHVVFELLQPPSYLDVSQIDTCNRFGVSAWCQIPYLGLESVLTPLLDPVIQHYEHCEFPHLPGKTSDLDGSRQVELKYRLLLGRNLGRDEK